MRLHPRHRTQLRGVAPVLALRLPLLGDLLLLLSTMLMGTSRCRRTTTTMTRPSIRPVQLTKVMMTSLVCFVSFTSIWLFFLQSPFNFNCLITVWPDYGSGTKMFKVCPPVQAVRWQFLFCTILFHLYRAAACPEIFRVFVCFISDLVCHSSLFCFPGSKMCPICNVPFSVWHFVFDCPLFAAKCSLIYPAESLQNIVSQPEPKSADISNV